MRVALNASRFAAVLLLVALAVPGAEGAGVYDPRRDPAKDLAVAMREARTTQRRILVVVGGEWCAWCVRLDRFVRATPDVRAAWDPCFVTVHVNVSDDNENAAFLAKYPEVPEYPYLFVLDSDGRLLHSQETSGFERGRTYSAKKLLAFLDRWRPPPTR